MATTNLTKTQCDLCGYDSTNGNLFTKRDEFDFCRWCMSGPVREAECGGHKVTVVDGSWSCDCGVTMAMLKHTLWRYGASHAVFSSVPHLDAATAAIHVQTPSWPQTW